MKAKILIATAMILGGSAMLTQAQVKQETPKANAQVTTGEKANFLKKVHAFEQEKNADQANTLLQELKGSMMKGLQDAKAGVAQAGDAGDQAATDKAMELNKKRSDSYNQLFRASKNTAAEKSSLVSILKKYAETL